MRRTRHDPYARSVQPAYIVFKDMQHQVFEVQRLEPATDLRGAMAATIEPLAANGWQTEGAGCGFVFALCEREGRLLMLTPGDPRDRQPLNYSTHLSSSEARKLRSSRGA